MSNASPLLAVERLSVSFESRSRTLLPAVRDVDFTIEDGEIMGLVGESGSGKSATMMAVIGLLPPRARVTGSVKFRGAELIGQAESFLRRYRGARIGMIFQDPMTTLNPLLTVGAQIAEAVRIHDRSVSARAGLQRAVELLDLVSIPSPRQRAGQYPHEFSGGMRQRAVIAMAMANDPQMLIADEPTTALDVTIQAQIMELLQRLCSERRMGLVLVTHDLGVVASVANKIAVMYAGRIVECGEVADVFRAPRHPYTRALLDSLPRIEQRVARLSAIPGAPPSLAFLPKGCAFHPRCRRTVDMCKYQDPLLRRIGHVDVACHRADEVSSPVRTTGETV
ncbi:peptide/nickel transport system ATP-binding protein [Mesorhizobium robiniae]|uniref:Peptide/nickel transport system ATP-binding protein n=1 Tax=Mesorhizobium robiniae TaxID=559315 RepID=A0ABV2GIR6_9HYPH